MIQKAQPKSGLETGSVQSADGLRPAQKTESVWNSPEPQQDSADDAMRDALSQIRILGGPGLVVTGGNGIFTISVAQRNSAGVTEDSLVTSTIPWDLVAGSTSGEFGIQNPGRIYTSFADLSSTLTVTDIDAQDAFGSGDVIYLKLETPLTPAVSLVIGSPWADHPTTYLIPDAVDPAQVEEAYFILWEGVSGTMPAGEFGYQFDGWWAKRYHRSADLVLAWGSHELDDTYRHLPVPVLMPF